MTITAAKQASVDGDFGSALKLYAVACKQSLSLYTQLRSASTKGNGDAHSRDRVKKRFRENNRYHIFVQAKEHICEAIHQCSCLADPENDIDNTSNDGYSQEIKQSILAIVDCFTKIDLVDSTLLSQASAYFLSSNDYNLALDLSQKAVVLDPASITAQEVFENVCCHIVERWHFVMLNDISRNQCYNKALLKAISSLQGDVRVCDIGCGTGLLSLIASQHKNCSNMYAVEKSDVMVNVARKVFSENLALEEVRKIHLINKMSTRMSVPEDIPHRVNIVVTETFDAGLFGEGILPTLCHAWEQLLDTEQSLVIPSKAKLYIQAIEADAILQESRVKSDTYGHNLDLIGVSVCSTVSMCAPDPYTTQDLKNLPGGFKPLTEPFEFMQVDFNNPTELRRLEGGATQHFSLSVTQAGRVDALAVWFSLCMLGDGSENVCTHTDCGSCWEQAVYPVNSYRLSQGSSLAVKAGDVLKVSQLVKKAQHCLSLTGIDRKDVDKPGNKSYDSGEDLVNVPPFLSSTLEWCKHGVYCLNTADIVTLNSSAFQRCLSHKLSGHISRDRTGHSVDFIHFNNTFSLLGLAAVRLGYGRAWTDVSSPIQQVLTWKVAIDNKIDQSALGLLTEMEDYIHSKIKEDSDEIEQGEETDEETKVPSALLKEDNSQTLQSKAQEVPSEKCLVVFDVVEWQGRLQENLKDQVDMIRESVSRYKEVCVLPCKMDVYGVLIHSDDLASRSRVVSDDNTLNFSIKKFINKFSTRNHQGFVLENLSHTKLCNPFKMFSIDLERLVQDSQQSATDHMCSSNQTKTSKCCSADEEVLKSSNNPFGSLADAKTFKHDNEILLPASSKNTSTICSSESNLSHVQSDSSQDKINASQCQASSDNKASSHYRNCPLVTVASDADDTNERNEAQHSHKVKSKPSAPETDKEEESASLLEESIHCEDWENSDGEFDQSKHIRVHITTPGSITALVYWFHLHMSNTTESVPTHHATQPRNKMHASSSGSAKQRPLSSSTMAPSHTPYIETIPDDSSVSLNKIDTLDPLHHWQQAAVMTHPSQISRRFEEGEDITLRCTMGSSAFSFWIKESNTET